MSGRPKKKKPQRRFHLVDLETLADDDHELPDWVAGAYKCPR